jgi:uncharacterized protein (DUF952 family)
MPAETRVLHLAAPEEWADAERSGWFDRSTRGLSLAEVGFIHCSNTDQVGEVLARYYADVGPLLLLVVDVDACEAAGSPVRWNPVDTGGPVPDRYPHVYGPIPVSAVVGTLPVTPGEPLPDLGSWRVAQGPGNTG